MELKRYIKAEGHTYRSFAESVGASERAVIKWCRRERIPRPRMLEKIRQATDNKVLPADFIGETAA